MPRAFSEIAFTPSVLKAQKHNGSVDWNATFLEPDIERGDRLGASECAFILARDGFYQATISSSGWPYVQFRGGPAGFLKVLDETTIAYADFRGNRQYISAGNLVDSNRMSLILMDYPNRRRLKLWGQARLIEKESDPALVSSLQMPEYRGLPERAVIIKVDAFDWNCPQHIPQRLTVKEFQPHLAPLHQQIAALQEENKSLKEFLA